MLCGADGQIVVWHARCLIAAIDLCDTDRQTEGDHMERKQKLMSMQDILEHLGGCFEEWQAADDHTERYLAEAIERDLNEFRKLCVALRTDRSTAHERQPVAA
jgi:hypothetical protein